MTGIRRLVWLVVCILVLSGCAEADTGVASAQEQVDQQESFTDALSEDNGDSLEEEPEWTKAYIQYFEELEITEYIQGLIIEDINSDGIPEIFYRLMGAPTIVSYTSHGIQHYDPPSHATTGSTIYLVEGTNQLLGTWEPHTVGTAGFEDYELSEWTENGYVLVLRLSRDAGYIVVDGTYITDDDGSIVLDDERPCYIDDELVTREEYMRVYEEDIASLRLLDIEDKFIDVSKMDVLDYLREYFQTL